MCRCVHPLYAAKALATVDHISAGRAGLNIVCGWNPQEFAMFGVKLGERGYDQAREWLEIIERAYAADASRSISPASIYQSERRRQPSGEPAASRGRSR